MSRHLLLFSLTLLLGWQGAFGSSPSCLSPNVGIKADGKAIIKLTSLVNNITDVGSVDLSVYEPSGALLLFAPGVGENDSIEINACPFQTRALTYVADAGTATCDGTITFTNGQTPILSGTTKVLSCDDPEINNPALSDPPDADVPCGPDAEVTFAADWVEPFECGSDTAKIIYREWEAFDKNGARSTTADTLIVLRLPPLTAENIFCVDKDTTYCGEKGDGIFGPYITFENPATNECDTIPLITEGGMATSLDPFCGLYLHVEKALFGASSCDIVNRYIIEIKQNCAGETQSTACGVFANGDNFTELAEGYFRCEFWHVDIDTVPPVVRCDISGYDHVDNDTIIFPASSHACEAHVQLPPVIATDECRGVKAVKARIDGIGIIAFSQVDDTTWASTETVVIPAFQGPFPIYIEAFDSCHQMAEDTCWAKVKDITPPVAVCDKGVNVTINGKKLWVEAETFNEGSWDNCNVNLVLARRTDWHTACIDLDSDIVFEGLSTKGHYDSIFCAVLEEDKHVDEVEAHYQKERDWLRFDGQYCGDLIDNAWFYELCRYATVDVKGFGTNEDFHHHFVETYGDSKGDPDVLKELGGGWSGEVPFDCSDACSSVTVELLVMDYWCNWSKCWGDVWVEDKTPPQVGRDVSQEIDISCAAYRGLDYELDGVHTSLEDIVAAAETGDMDALDALDDIFGGYEKVWKDEHGNFVDASGEQIDKTVDFEDRGECVCEEESVQRLIEDEHLGELWITETETTCTQETVNKTFNIGAVVVNCSENIQCSQEVWSSFDHCGQGVIFRKFKFWNGCTGSDGSSHGADTIFRKQQIWVGNTCELDSAMFTMPEDTTVTSCILEFDFNGSGNVGGALSPENLGEPTYNFDDDCRIVGIGYSDKVFDVVGGDEACYKIIRTWHFTDWCEVDKPIAENWWVDPTYSGEIFTHVQKIVVLDTLPPTCLIDPIPGDTISTVNCEGSFATTVHLADACGLVEYFWEIKTSGGSVVRSGNGSIDMGMQSLFDINETGLAIGSYKLVVVVRDNCENESTCQYEFSIVGGKKPALTCITMISIELTPMDFDLDNEADTAMGVIWAEEYIASSEAPCDSDESNLVYRIEFAQDGDGSTVPSADSLPVGCATIPVGNVVEVWVWVLDTVSGTADYCSAFLEIQTNMGGCGDISRSSILQGNVTTEMGETIEHAEVIATLNNGSILNFITQANGDYLFGNLQGQDVQIELVKNTDYTNGVSTSDLIMIQKHILGHTELPNRYRMEAADATRDGRVSPRDLVELRQLILGITDELENSNSWVFLNNETDEYTYELSDMDDNMQLDWTGVKIGDVNLDNNPKRSRSQEALTFQVQDKLLKKDETTIVEMKVDQFNELEGYQFTIQFASEVEIISMSPVSDELNLTDGHFGMNHQDDGFITATWYDVNPTTIAQGTGFVQIEVRSATDVMLSSALTINGKVTAAEAYTADNELIDVAIHFETKDQLQAELYQNQPNPFNESTVIQFYLPQQSSADIAVYDVTGRLINKIRGDYAQGLNQIVLDRDVLPAAGIYYYQLHTDHTTIMKKMILVE